MFGSLFAALAGGDPIRLNLVAMKQFRAVRSLVDDYVHYSVDAFLLFLRRALSQFSSKTTAATTTIKTNKTVRTTPRALLDSILSPQRTIRIRNERAR